MSEIILYDLPSRDPCRSWSLNPLKTRYLLNFKSLPYTTKWLEYPEVAPTLEKLGVTPNPPSAPTPYSSPAITLPDGKTHVMDSQFIADELEKLYPEPAAKVADPITARTTQAVADLFGSIRPVLMPRVPRKLLNPVSATYFQETRAKRVGMPLDKFEAEKGGEPAWAAAQKPLAAVAELLHADSSGPFLLGKDVCYADFILVGFLQFCVVLGEGGGRGDVYDKIVGHDKAFGQVYDACAKWTERDSY